MGDWTPANLSGSKLHRWINGESFSHSGSTITGGTTSDSSATTISSSSWPTYNASALNGYPTITSGGSNLMSLPVDIDYDWSVFVVVKPSALSSYHNVYEQSGDKSPMLWIDSSNRFSMNGAGAVIEPSTPTADGSTWRVVSTINRASGTRSEERIDGTSRGTNVESVGSLNVGTGLTLKLLGRSSGNGLQGDLAEFVITYGALTSDDEARIEGYLAWKYGLQGNLDSGHTYKSAAPTDGQASLTAEAGSFTLTGQAAGLRADRLLSAEAGSFTLSGQAAGLQAQRRMAAGTGAFDLTGQDAGLRVTRRMTAEAGSFTLSGQSATLVRALRLTAGTGAFSLIGQDAALNVAGSSTLAAETGVFALGGQAAGLRAARRLAAEPGSFSLAGQAAGMRVARLLTADAGVFTLAGQPAGLRVARRLGADAGSFVLTGQDAALLLRRRLSADTGMFELVGREADFGFVGGDLRAQTGVFLVTGHAVRLVVVLATLPGRIGGRRRPVLGGAGRRPQLGPGRPSQRI